MHRDSSPLVAHAHCSEDLHKGVVAARGMVILSQLQDILNIAYLPLSRLSFLN